MTNPIHLKFTAEVNFQEILNTFHPFNDFEVDINTLKKSNLVVHAETDNRIVGYGIVTRNRLHQKRPKIFIFVDPNFRRQKIGSLIHKFILDTKDLLKPDDIAFDMAAFDHDTAALNFIQSVGYRPYLDCYILKWSLTQSASQANIKTPISIYSILNSNLKSNLDTRFQSNADVKILSMAETTISNTEILNFIIQYYSQTHDWSPVTIDKSDPIWSTIVFNAINKNSSLVLLGSDNKLLGVSIVHSSNTITADIMWLFTVDLDNCNNSNNSNSNNKINNNSVSNLNNYPNTTLLFSQQLSHLTKMGFSFATIEIDSTDAALSSQLNYFQDKHREQQIWHRFQLLK